MSWIFPRIVQVQGPITPGHCVTWIDENTIGDSGAPCGGGGGGIMTGNPIGLLLALTYTIGGPISTAGESIGLLLSLTKAS